MRGGERGRVGQCGGRAAAAHKCLERWHDLDRRGERGRERAAASRPISGIALLLFLAADLGGDHPWWTGAMVVRGRPTGDGCACAVGRGWVRAPVGGSGMGEGGVCARLNVTDGIRKVDVRRHCACQPSTHHIAIGRGRVKREAPRLGAPQGGQGWPTRAHLYRSVYMRCKVPPRQVLVD